MDEENVRRKDRVGEVGHVGVFQGMSPGRHIHHIGVLDLRQVPAEHLQDVEEVGWADVVLLAEENRLALAGVKLHHSQSVLVADPEERVLVTPQVDLSHADLEVMPDGQRVLVIGNLYLKPGIPAALAAQKFASVRVVGIFIAGAGAYGGLMGRMEFLHGVSLALPDDVGPVTRSMGEMRMNAGYLAGLPDGTTYINVGETKIGEDVSPDLIRQKIRAYYNAGQTSGPASVLSAIQSLCAVNAGRFHAG